MLDTILGQPHAIDSLRTALQSDRVHHAWIFAGPRGVGKFTAALSFARILLDPEAQPNLVGVIESDPGSRSNQLIDAGSHPDLHIIRKELALFSDNRSLRTRKLMNIPVDLLREHMIGGMTQDGEVHQAAAYRTALHGTRKVFIIDEAELLDNVGQNALLKTLEEPPADTHIFLITSRPHRLLPTIHSRCQTVRFGSLDTDAMQQWFARADLSLSSEAQQWIEWFADGSPGIAHLAAEYKFYDWHVQIAPMLRDLDNGRYPADLGATLGELADEFAKLWVKNNKNASKDAANKDGTRHLFSILGSYARRQLNTAPDADAAEPWLRRIDLLTEAETQLQSNVNMKQVFENLVIQWAETPLVIPA